MSPKVNTLFEALEGKNPSISLLEEKVKKALGKSQDLLQVISEINNEMYLTKDVHDNRVPFYWFYLSIAHYVQNENGKAKDALANSILGFRTQGLNLNEAIGEWLFGIIHYKSKKPERAHRACNTASAILQDLVRQSELNRGYQKAKKYKIYLRKIKALNKLINTKSQPGANEGVPQPNVPRRQDYLLLQWLPVCENVRAGRQGIIWGNPSAHTGTTIRAVELDGKQYSVFSVQSSEKITDHQITLMREGNYFWAKVKGHSMNASAPVHIDEGDYVLCSLSWSGDQDAIVIAAFLLADQETSVMVKKYAAADKLLVSETSDTQEDYSPIQITEGYHILGTVLAVAKPAK